MADRTIADLREAAYNPRTITPLQIEALRKSYEKYGDLSGIVFNRSTGQLVGGHQRVNLFRKARATKIVVAPYKDATGTVAHGHVVVARKEGGTTRIPYREVVWDGDTEMGANIAANAAGGTFDHVKLGRVLARLERRKFAIHEIPLNSVELSRAKRMFEHMERQKTDVGAMGEFAVIDPEAVRASLEHACPSCGYMWSGSTKPSIKANAVRSKAGKAGDLTENQKRIKAASAIVAKRRALRGVVADSKMNDAPRKRAGTPSRR